MSKDKPDIPGYLTVPEVTEATGYDNSTLHNFCREGRIKCRKEIVPGQSAAIWYIAENEVPNLIKHRKKWFGQGGQWDRQKRHFYFPGKVSQQSLYLSEGEKRELERLAEAAEMEIQDYIRYRLFGGRR